MKIFVTGATGFIGSHVINEALLAGHAVLGLQRSTQSKPVIPLIRQPKWLHKKLESIDTVDLKDIDVIIHLAATGVSPRIATWSELESVNIRGTLHMCELAKKIQASLVITGSYSEYGLSGMSYDYIPPNAPLEPTFPYAASKAAASILAMTFSRSEDLRVSYLRVFNAYGDGQYHSNLWPSMRKAALNGDDFPITLGEQIRDFVNVSSVANSIISEATKLFAGDPKYVVKNLGSGQPQTIRAFCEDCWNRWQAHGKLLVGALPYREGEVMRYVPEI